MASNHDNHHITPFSTYAKVLALLVALTFLTVIAHQMHLGSLAGPVAFIIALVKAMFVMMYFMHLKYESTINRITFGLGFFFLALLFGFCALDIWTRVLETSAV